MAWQSGSKNIYYNNLKLEKMNAMNIIKKHNYILKTKINDKSLELVSLHDEHLPFTLQVEQ